jgi:hypothetical protein
MLWWPWGLLPLRSIKLLVSEQSRGRCKVEIFAEALSAIAAVVLTVACGLLCEELLFGGLVRLFVPPRTAAANKPAPAQEEKGERTCLP